MNKFNQQCFYFDSNLSQRITESGQHTLALLIQQMLESGIDIDDESVVNYASNRT